MKSSLKTFLAGKNPYIVTDKRGNTCVKLKDSTWLGMATKEDVGSTFFGGCLKSDTKTDVSIFIDVLDDGTAITYCPDK
jgi:hypothetical protein